ncbi:hypothetical protein [Mycoplasmopsis fermentans]|uniref:hypothetical protein n=1 Tax=Mycoplasmopsis fermentans TaxID=2115 RepID=UPI0002F783AE|nr:hypothetical protein [Mycoplasmopsis fermentans]
MNITTTMFRNVDTSTTAETTFKNIQHALIGQAITWSSIILGSLFALAVIITIIIVSLKATLGKRDDSYQEKLKVVLKSCLIATAVLLALLILTPSILKIIQTNYGGEALKG